MWDDGEFVPYIANFNNRESSLDVTDLLRSEYWRNTDDSFTSTPLQFSPLVSRISASPSIQPYQTVVSAELSLASLRLSFEDRFQDTSRRVFEADRLENLSSSLVISDRSSSFATYREIRSLFNSDEEDDDVEDDIQDGAQDEMDLDSFQSAQSNTTGSNDSRSSSFKLHSPVFIRDKFGVITC